MESDTGERVILISLHHRAGGGERLPYKCDGDARHLTSTKIAGFGLTYCLGGMESH